jgi:hypothetical protein
MATQTSVTVIDDITGEPGAETVTFGIDGGWYELDLTSANRDKLYSSLADFVAKARKVTSKTRKAGKASPVQLGTASATRDRAQTKAIREWARGHGYQISDRGRIPLNVETAYNANDPSQLGPSALASVG